MGLAAARPPTRLGAAGPQPLTTWELDKGWGPPTFHDWQKLRFPDPSRLANGQGLGAPQPGPSPNPSRLANGQGLGAPQPLTTWGGNHSRLEVAEPSTLYDLGWVAPNPSPKIGKPVTGPFGPELPSNAKLKFCSWCDVWVRLGRTPPTLHDLRQPPDGQGLGPPNPSRLVNGQGLRPPTLHDLPPTLHDLGRQGLQPFTT